jgi:NhaA family Na+:H+ antiporter
MFRVCKINLMMTNMRRFIRLYGSSLFFLTSAALGLWSSSSESTRLQPPVRELLLNGPIQWIVIAPFFFLVGVELKREFLTGALRPWRNAISPTLAAVFGVAFPALWFYSLTAGSPASVGWPIPTATDVTFALVVFTAFGRVLPRGARVFLLSFAVIDDLIAVLIITVMFGASRGVGWAELLPVVLAFITPMRWPAKIEAKLSGYLTWFGLPSFVFLICQEGLMPLSAVAGSLVFWGIAARPFWKWLGVFVGGLLGRRWARGDMYLDTRTLLAVSSLGGIGFTVSLLVTQIAFQGEGLETAAAISATFLATGVSVLLGAIMLMALPRNRR